MKINFSLNKKPFIYNKSSDFILFLCVETGQEKNTIKAYAHKVKQEGDDVMYEAEFKVGSDFGEIGAVVVENEHHKEMFLADIVLDGFNSNGPISVKCNSWVHSKYDNPQNRIFFTDKVTILNSLPLIYLFLFLIYLSFSYFKYFINYFLKFILTVNSLIIKKMKIKRFQQKKKIKLRQ